MDGFTEEDVENVLDYWFGGLQPHLNYKTKWFPTGSTDLQSKADAEVTTKFAPLLERTLNLNPQNYPRDKRFLIAVIIVLDQFSRHIYRELSPDNVLRKEADSKASVTADMLMSLSNWDHNMSIAEFVFSLMPFRHASTLDRLNQVMVAIDQRVVREKENMELLAKFKKQTIRRLQHLQDRAQAEESDDILEHHESSIDLSTADLMKEPLVIATKLFLERNIKSTPVDLVISLSGGVDSMVIAKILALLLPTLQARKLVAMHIDYANRTESSREAAFVHEWATRHGFEVHTRVVGEVTRGVTNRSDYEKISRQIRYGFYRDVLCAGGWDGNTTGGGGGVGVIFGHHEGDIQENVISNIMRGCSPLNLAGMTSVGITEGVPIWRPLLSHTKKDILLFAHKYGVPYFKDTTPSWSTRGKLRNQLLPLLVDMYGAGCLNNIASLAIESDEAKELVHNSVYKPFLDSVQTYPTGLIVQVMTRKDQPVSFWREMLKELMHSMSMSMVRDKAVMNFVERLQREVPRTDIWLELRKGFNTFLDCHGDLIIFRDKVLRIEGGYRESTKQGGSAREAKGLSSLSLEETQHNDHSGVITLSDGQSIQLDSWLVRCEVLASRSDLVKEATESRILASPRVLMEKGAFSYLLQGVTQTAGRVQLLRHQGSSRPPVRVPALHGMDSKLRMGLPFLVPCLPPPLPLAVTTTPHLAVLNKEPLFTDIVRLSYSFNL